MNKNIVLIGLMGSGKTTLGKALAEKSGMEFVDTDALIIQRAGKPISEIFAEDGEGVFRDYETEVIKEISQKRNAVISTGGGAVLRDENVENLKFSGILFFLKATPEALYERVKNDTARPLLRGDDPVNILRSILAARAMFYEQADYTINTEEFTIEQECNEILRLYNGYIN